MGSYVDALTFMASNLGMELIDIIVLITILSCIILAAKDIRLALIVGFFLLAGEYIVFSLIGWNSFKALIATLAFLVMLALSLYVSHGRKYGGAIV